MTGQMSRKLEGARIAGVVVLFKPPDSVLQNIETYLVDVNTLYVFDNSPGSQTTVKEALCQVEKVKYLAMGKNVGIAKALNVAAKRALGEGFDYLLTMDQDSAATQGMVRRMLGCIHGDPSVGMITPFHQDRNAPKAVPDSEVEPVLVAMTSGSLVNLRVYNAIGGFMEKLFIDYVDTEFCLRLHTKGYRVVRANKAVLSHSLGNFTARRFLGRTVYPYNHIPIRLYYQSRNRFFLRRLYGSLYPEYFSYDLKLFLGGIVKIVLFEEKPARKLLMVLRGLIALWRDDFRIVPIPEQ